MASTEECARQNFSYIGHGEGDVYFLVFGLIREVNFVGFWKYMTARFEGDSEFVHDNRQEGRLEHIFVLLLLKHSC
jgi:hypothetical protein